MLFGAVSMRGADLFAVFQGNIGSAAMRPDTAALRPDLATLVLLAGIAALLVPIVGDLWRASWTPDSGSHVPFVLGAMCYLIWRDRDVLSAAQRKRGLVPLTLVASLLPLLVIARIARVAQAEGLFLLVILALIAWIELGPVVLRRMWFAIALSPFLLTPSNSIVLALTHPLKLWLTTIAVWLTSQAGLDVGSSGTIIQIDGYSLLVATACSGINSLIGAIAICLFYVYVRHGAQPVRALVLYALLVPVVVFVNLLRILTLIVATHFFGDEVVEGVFHPIAGVGVFALSIGILFVFDVLVPARIGAARLGKSDPCSAAA